MSSKPMETVHLNSTRNITVYQNISYKDKSIDIDRVKVVVGESAKLLNVYPTWHNVKCFISKGNGHYPANILEWTSVQSLIHRGVITLFDPVLNEKIKREYGKKEAFQLKEATPEEEPKSVTKKVAEKKPGRPPRLTEVAEES